jgi:hypothetical protein
MLYLTERTKINRHQILNISSTPLVFQWVLPFGVQIGKTLES